MKSTYLLSACLALLLMHHGRAVPVSSNTLDLLPTIRQDPANTKPRPLMQATRAKDDTSDDDVLWQNILAAEWIIWSFYDAGVHAFNSSSFTELGLPNTTYQRVTDIRDNEAGHLRIFQGEISSGSVQPGPCEYNFPFDSDPTTFLALSTLIESLLDVWTASPFSGPSDTVFPYPNEILDVTNRFVVPGSCPPANPVFPNPSQYLPKAGVAAGTESVAVGATVQLNFTEPDNQPRFAAAAQYYAVFYHAIEIVSLPLRTDNSPAEPINVTIPLQFSPEGVVIMVIADAEGAPHLDSVVADPVIFLQQPAALGTQVN
ncbi:hypothetical protein PG994_006969 [Apiospora phragmitis]|uniref:Uncharacterized protein n=1 Tax=Apiospora phragmitis TaxID=2905665 RepID=A0ABR1UZH6_9PEZI